MKTWDEVKKLPHDASGIESPSKHLWDYKDFACNVYYPVKKLEDFPNGFTSWLETHHEVVAYITQTSHFSGSMANKAVTVDGTGALYELGEQLTNEFENLYKEYQWDGEFYDTIDDFLKSREKL